MARKYGGKYSPEDRQDPAQPPRGPFDGARVDPAGARANVMFVPAIPLVLMSLNDGAIGLSLAVVAAGMLTLAAWLLREGLRAEAAFAARKVARRPAFPRKMAASLLTGLGIFTAAFKNEVMEVMFQTEPQLAAPALFGLIAMVLHGAAFGIDPLKDKGVADTDSFQHDRVARVVTEAETYLRAMTEAVGRAGDRQMETRVERFQTTARDLFRTVEEDPRDLAGARRFMTVYLMGARDAAQKWADIHTRTRDPQARADFAALLDDLEKNFAARTRKMLLDDRSDLTIEIDVLRERLQREGVRLDD